MIIVPRRLYALARSATASKHQYGREILYNVKGLKGDDRQESAYILQSEALLVLAWLSQRRTNFVENSAKVRSIILVSSGAQCLYFSTCQRPARKHPPGRYGTGVPNHLILNHRLQISQYYQLRTEYREQRDR